MQHNLIKVLIVTFFFCTTTVRSAPGGENDLDIYQSPDSWAIRLMYNNIHYDWCFVAFAVVVPAEHTRQASLYIWNPGTSAWVLYHTYSNIADGVHYASWFNDPNDANSGGTEINFAALYDTYYVKVEFFDAETGLLDIDYITIDDPPE